MSALTEMVEAMDVIVAAGLQARRDGVDRPLGCDAGCRIDAALDAVSLDPSCEQHATLLAAYQTRRRI